jgi:hypothetical protein
LAEKCPEKACFMLFLLVCMGILATFAALSFASNEDGMGPGREVFIHFLKTITWKTKKIWSPQTPK